eukprot:4808947-Prymnesium_polylepis.1
MPAQHVVAPTWLKPPHCVCSATHGGGGGGCGDGGDGALTTSGGLGDTVVRIAVAVRGERSPGWRRRRPGLHLGRRLGSRQGRDAAEVALALNATAMRGRRAGAPSIAARRVAIGLREVAAHCMRVGPLADGGSAAAARVRVATCPLAAPAGRARGGGRIRSERHAACPVGGGGGGSAIAQASPVEPATRVPCSQHQPATGPSCTAPPHEHIEPHPHWARYRRAQRPCRWLQTAGGNEEAPGGGARCAGSGLVWRHRAARGAPRLADGRRSVGHQAQEDR